MKTQHGGVKTAEECQHLNEAHRQLGLNIVIRPEETCKNPGMKEIAKLCLNSLWGKFGQRPDVVLKTIIYLLIRYYQIKYLPSPGNY